MNKIEVIQLLSILSSAFPIFEISEETTDLYIFMLEDIPVEVGVAAARLHISKSKFFPTISELRGAAAEVATAQTPSPEKAWEIVVQLIQEYGLSRAVPEKVKEKIDPLVFKAIKTMGWVALNESTNPSIDRAQYMKIYANYRNRKVDEVIIPDSVKQVTQSLLKKLPGGAEENGSYGKDEKSMDRKRLK